MFQRILVPVDGSRTSACGLGEAIRLAKLTGARIRLLHVLGGLNLADCFAPANAYLKDVIPLMRKAGERILDQAAKSVAEAGLSVERQLLDAPAVALVEVVAEQARDWQADLIVIGTHGRRGLDRVLLGSDTEQILRSAPVPVLLVRAAARLEHNGETASTRTVASV